MPEPKRNRLAATVFFDPDLSVAPRKRPKKKHPRRAKRYHRVFRLPIALGLFPTRSRQCDPFGLRLTTMHIMEGDCEKTPGCLAAEDAPQLKPTSNGIEKSPKEESGGERSPERGTGSPEQAERSPERPRDSPEVAASPAQPLENGHVDEQACRASEATEEQGSPSPETAGSVSPQTKDISEPPVPNSVNTDPPHEPSPKIQEEKEEACSEEEEKPNLEEPIPSSLKPEVRRKRSIDADREGEASSSSESDSARKRLKHEVNKEPLGTSTPLGQLNVNEDERENTIQRFIEGCAQSIEEISFASEKLQKEMGALSELARAKELEWNSILRLKKLKEEMFERLQRKRREVLVMEGKYNEDILHSNPVTQSGINAMMVPMVSSSPAGSRMPDLGKQRPLLPKPFPHALDSGPPREGRNGHIINVKSLIADYSHGVGCRRSRHPESSAPRRGRRPRGEAPRLSSSPSLISMANMALGTGSSVRTVQDPPPYPPPPLGQDGMPRGDFSGGMSFKDALVQFAKLGPGGGGGPRGGSAPYPEVTLHPVGAPPTSSSLLHGILTKAPAPAPAHSKPTTFSPTLARLLTAPDSRPQPAHQNSSPHFNRPPSVNINEILASKKSRTDITITPVSGNPTKPKEEVVLLDDDEEASGGDRLVIDEGPEGGSDDVPQCQGCRQKSAQFVCAGCGNQWYCSRECQVTAWEEHSDVCSG